MQTHIFCGKGGVGKTISAVSLALFFSQKGTKTAIIDYDGGHSVKNTLGLDGNLNANIVQKIKPNLYVAVIDNVNYLSIAQSQAQSIPLDLYLQQFPEDLGILPLADMVNAFFGVPTDVPTLQKFMTLVKILLQFEEAGFADVIIDVEPTAGFERLLSNASATARSIRNLKNQGKISLAVLGVKWPDIAYYLQGDYIKNAEIYSKRIERAVDVIKNAAYLLVCIPETGPISQMFEVRQIIERFGGKVQKYIVNNIQGEDYEDMNIDQLASSSLPIIRVRRRRELHTENPNRSRVLLDIGEAIALSL